MRDTGVSPHAYIPIEFHNIKLLQDSLSACVYTHLNHPPAMYILDPHYLLNCFLRNHSIYLVCSLAIKYL